MRRASTAFGGESIAGDQVAMRALPAGGYLDHHHDDDWRVGIAHGEPSFFVLMLVFQNRAAADRERPQGRGHASVVEPP